MHLRRHGVPRRRGPDSWSDRPSHCSLTSAGLRSGGPLGRVDRAVHRLHALCRRPATPTPATARAAPRATGDSRPATTARTTWPTDSSGTGCPTPALHRSRGTPPTGGRPSPPRRTAARPSAAVAWWNTSFSSTGHVAYVEKVISPSEILVSEDNWGGDFRWRRVTLTGGRWPTGFIHLKDQGASAATTSRAWQVAGPSRVMDTRTGLGAPLARVGAGRAVTFQVAGRGGLPSTGVAKVMLNINATSPTTNGYLTVHASGTTQPGSRSASIVAARPNTKAVLSSGRRRTAGCASTPPRTTDLSVDVVGWSAIAVATCPAGHRCVCSTPARAWVPRRPSSRPGGTLDSHGRGQGGRPDERRGGRDPRRLLERGSRPAAG